MPWYDLSGVHRRKKKQLHFVSLQQNIEKKTYLKDISFFIYLNAFNVLRRYLLPRHTRVDENLLYTKLICVYPPSFLP